MAIEKQIRKVTQVKPEHDFLITVPGIGKSLVLTVMLETGDINRFKAVGNYASYCRCVASKRLSNNKSKGENNRKNGNKYLSWAFVEIANCACFAQAQGLEKRIDQRLADMRLFLDSLSVEGLAVIGEPKRYCPQARAFYLKKSLKTNKALAIKALAHKLARACYYIMKDNVAFDVAKIFGKPILKNGCGREPNWGLGHQPSAPIGQPAAADF